VEVLVPELHIRRLSDDEVQAWPQELLTNAGFTALDSWPGFIRDVYDYNFYRFEAREGDEVRGILTLSEVHHPIFGNYLTTAPFASYGGFAYKTEQARDGLLEAAKDLRVSLNLEYAVVRFEKGTETPPDDWQQHAIYSTYLVDLEPDVETIVAGFSSNHRNHVRKSQKKDLSIRFGHLELLEDAYIGLARSMHELGSPYHSKEYLQTMGTSLGVALNFGVVYASSGDIVGSGVFIIQGQMVTNLHANILRKYRSIYAGEYLYWAVIEQYREAGLKTFDLGRSLNGSGNEDFKMKWNPRKQTLAYWYNLDGKELPTLNQKNPKFRLAIWTWKRLPSFVVDFLGPSLIRGLA
jgi:FemAB-related protein (PEP-CTERM system-associated)